MTLVASTETLAEARNLLITNAQRISFEGRMYREDLGSKEFS